MTKRKRSGGAGRRPGKTPKKESGGVGGSNSVVVEATTAGPATTDGPPPSRGAGGATPDSPKASTGQGRGRPPGSKTQDLPIVRIIPGVCPPARGGCGSAERTAYFDCSAQDVDGEPPRRLQVSPGRDRAHAVQAVRADAVRENLLSALAPLPGPDRRGPLPNRSTGYNPPSVFDQVPFRPGSLAASADDGHRG